jgi:hypothetical protein
MVRLPFESVMDSIRDVLAIIERYNSRMDTTELVAEIDAEITRLKDVKALLTGQAASPRRGRPPVTKTKTAGPGRRTMSPEGRARIVAAQKARWAKAKKK